MTVAQIGDVLGVSRTTIYRALNGQRRGRTAAAEKRRVRGRGRALAGLRLHVEDQVPLAALAGTRDRAAHLGALARPLPHQRVCGPGRRTTL